MQLLWHTHSSSSRLCQKANLLKRCVLVSPLHTIHHNTPVAAGCHRGLINPLIAPINPDTLELIRVKWQFPLEPDTVSECWRVSAGYRKWCQSCQQLIFTSAGCNTPTPLPQVFDLIKVQVRLQQTLSWCGEQILNHVESSTRRIWSCRWAEQVHRKKCSDLLTPESPAFKVKTEFVQLQQAGRLIFKMTFILVACWGSLWCWKVKLLFFSDFVSSLAPAAECSPNPDWASTVFHRPPPADGGLDPSDVQSSSSVTWQTSAFLRLPSVGASSWQPPVRVSSVISAAISIE